MRFRLPSAALRLSAASVAVTALALAGALLWLQFGPTSTPTASAGATTKIAVGNLWFCNSSFEFGTCVTKINVGDTVEWNFSGSAHTSTSSGNWSSGTQTSGTSFSRKFNDPGEFDYRCNFHPAQMRGTIIVNGDPPTATPPSPTATPVTPPPTATPVTPSPTATPVTPTPPPTNTPPGQDTPTPTNTPMEPTSTPTDAPPTPTPTKQSNGDTDNDGCLDTRENGLDETLGGRRDYLNFWDFVDPTRDGAVGLLDFLAVLRHFGTVGDRSTLDPDGPEPPIGEYWALADRGGQAPGGDPWDELPANGSIGLTDFLSVLRQFGHTCL